MKLNKIRIHECGVKEQFADRIRIVFYLCLIAALLICTAWMVNHGLRQAIVVGGVIGVLVHWVTTRRCFFVLDGKRDLQYVADSLFKIKYAKFGSGDNYRLTLPRWMYFNHQDVNVNINSDMVIVTGPRYVINALVKLVYGNLD